MSDGTFSSSMHPHEPEAPPVIDHEGRCLVCAALTTDAEAERLRGLVADLAKYVWHKDLCALVGGYTYPCDCGLADLLARSVIGPSEACGVAGCTNPPPNPEDYASCFYDGSPCSTRPRRSAIGEKG